MSGTSSKTSVIRLRLPNEIIEKVTRRVENNPNYKTVSSYLRDRIIYDVNRKHVKHSDNGSLKENEQDTTHNRP